MAQVPLPLARPYLLYDLHVIDPPNGPQHAPAVGSTWEEFRTNDKMVLKLMKWSQGDGNIPQLPGERSSRVFFLAGECGKNASRSLLCNLQMMEEDGYCLVDLDEANVRVFGRGEVKFTNVQLERKQDLGDEAFEARLQANTQSASLLIERLFSEYGVGSIPSDIRLLMDLLDDHFEDRAVFPIHSSLAPMISYSALLKEFHDILSHDISDADYHEICAVIIDDLGGMDWRWIVNENQLLRETFTHKNQGIQYQMPQSYHQICSALQNLHWSPAPNAPAAQAAAQNAPAQITQHEINIVDGDKLLTFLRNRHAHRMEALAKLLQSWNLQYAFTAKHTERVVLARFQRVLSIVQIKLYRRGYLSAEMLYDLGNLFNLGLS